MDAAHLAQDADPGSGGNLALQLILIFILILVNAFFAASEMAIVSLDDRKIREKAEKGNKKAAKILVLIEDPSRFLSTIQVCITLAGFFNSASAATGIANRLGGWFLSLGMASGIRVATILITILISFITIIFGELVPKRLALRDPEAFAFKAIGVLWGASKFLKPAVNLLSNATNGILRLHGVEVTQSEEKVTLSDIQSILQMGQSQGLINQDEEQMINSLIKFDDITAEEIMTPRTDVVALDINDPLEEFEDALLEARYSRIPIYEDDIDNIIGLLYIKDYIRAAYDQGFDHVQIREILREPYFVPERKNVTELFNEMRDENLHMAILIDEYGGFSGLITMEDLIEEVVGDIDDEYDQEEDEIEQVSRDTYYAQGSLSIKDLNLATGASLDEDAEDYDTLAGLLFYLMGRVPSDDEHPFIAYEGMRFSIERMDQKRISRVRIKYDPDAVQESQDEETEED